MKVGIHQPNFMPWFGYFKKIKDCDTFVFLDDVKCSKNSFFNRNRFSTGSKLDNFFWLTCPVNKKNYKMNICEVFVDKNFIKKHKRHFEMRHSKTKEIDFLNRILSVYDKYLNFDSQEIPLSEFNIEICKITCDALEISKNTKFVKSSNLNISNRSSFNKQSLVIEIVKMVEGDTYLSGQGAKSYQKEVDFKEENISLEYQSLNQEKLLKVNGENISLVDVILIEGICKVRKMISD
jgi:hypothetical protein